ncbi:MAG: hypothetical protein ACPL7M_11955, partial [Bryobacteraceae bacterium]
LALPAVAMSLGWGLRGFIGGGPLGAIIPGAMIGLVLAVLLWQQRQAAWLAACAAAGVGLGGQMTYGQTVGLSLRPESFWWAMLGFAVKGGVWGLAGGAVFGAGLLRGRTGWKDARFLCGLVAMLAATWAGWRLVNAPRLVYFSDPLNRPREEVWAGLLAGAVAFLLCAAHGRAKHLPWRFALWAGAGGALGFPLGAALQAWGRRAGVATWLDWWKGMEFTYGALLGLGFGIAAWLSRSELPPTASAGEPGRSVPQAASLVLAAAAVATLVGIDYRLELRFNYSVAAALALAAALRSDVIAEHVAMTVTATAFVLDLTENIPALSHAMAWLAAAAAGAAVAWRVSGRLAPREMLSLLMWAAVAVSVVKTFAAPGLVSPGHLLTECTFVLMAWLCIRWLPAEETNREAGPATVAS